MSSANKEKQDEEAYFTGEWIREATMWEKMMETGHKNGCFLIWYQLNLKSKKPLEDHHVRITLQHLYRRTPNLGCTLGSRDGELWLRRASNRNVDFEVLEGKTVDEVRDILRAYKYNTDTGPLFCGRLLKNSPDKVDDPEDLDPDMSHSYYMLFGFHHAITDGTSNMHIMGFFMSMLNDVISGKPIDDTEPLGEYLYDEWTHEATLKRMKLLEEDPTLKEKLLLEKEKLKSHVPYIISGFEAPVGEDKKTYSLEKVLDKKITSAFIQRCRTERVTVNSAFTAVVCVALTDILVDHGVLQDVYTIYHGHLVSMRRYWEIKYPIALGLHVAGPLFGCANTPKNFDADNFWDYARSIHKEVKNYVESGQIFFDIALHVLTSSGHPYPESFLLSEKPYEGSFTLSNLGNVTTLVTEGGDHVRVTHVQRSTTFHLIDTPTMFNFHTFRGKFMMTFDYNTAAVRRDVVEKILSQIDKRFRAVCH